MKVLILMNQHYNEVGGVEKYNKKIIELLSDKKIDFDIFIFGKKAKTDYYKKFKNSNLLLGSWYLYKYIKISRKLIYKFDTSKYDLVIDSTYIYFKKLMNHNNYLWIQHNCPNFYKGKITNNFIINFFYMLFMKLNGIGNYFKAYSVVCFDNENISIVNNHKTKFFSCPLTVFDRNFLNKIKIDIHKKKHFSYLGRLDVSQKNISILNKINEPVYVYGSGKDIKKLTNKQLVIKNKYSHNDLSDIFNKTKYVLLPSNYEGFPFVVVEALSFGVPVLIKDSFPSASYLAIDQMLLAKNNKDFLNKIKFLKDINDKEYLKLANKAKNFATKNLCNDIFAQKWDEIIRYFKK